MRIGGTWAALLVALALSRSLHGQERDSIGVGERVRVTLRGNAGRVQGEVLVLLPDTLVVSGATGSEATLVPLGSIRSLHVYRGRKSGAGLGAMIVGIPGFVAGALVGISSAPYSLDDCPDDPDVERGLSCSFHTGVDVGWVLLLGAAVGLPAALVGDLLGRPFRMDDWRRLRPDRLRFRIEPLPGGSVGVGFAVAF